MAAHLCLYQFVIHRLRLSQIWLVTQQIWPQLSRFAILFFCLTLQQIPLYRILMKHSTLNRIMVCVMLCVWIYVSVCEIEYSYWVGVYEYIYLFVRLNTYIWQATYFKQNYGLCYVVYVNICICLWDWIIILSGCVWIYVSVCEIEYLY